ncbi:MAG: cupin domain-containing protein [Gemmatimonadota bacterium]|nr:MAG: cupin domain-containing protein [Gemmatimonadota bacterium]
MIEYKVDFDSIPWESPMTGLRARKKIQENKQLRLVEYTKEMEPHWCEKGHIGYVLDGQFEIQFEKKVIVFNPGDGIFIPSGPEHKHMGRVLSDVVRVIFVEDV